MSPPPSPASATRHARAAQLALVLFIACEIVEGLLAGRRAWLLQAADEAVSMGPAAAVYAFDVTITFMQAGRALASIAVILTLTLWWREAQARVARLGGAKPPLGTEALLLGMALFVAAALHVAGTLGSQDAETVHTQIRAALESFFAALIGAPATAVLLLGMRHYDRRLDALEARAAIATPLPLQPSTPS
jgi:hypothetical protein